MFEAHHHAVLDFLRSGAGLAEEQVTGLVAEHDATGTALIDLALAHGWCGRADLLAALARYLGLEFLDTVPEALDGSLLAMVPGHLARSYGVAPWRSGAETVDLLAVDPLNSRMVEDLTFALGREVKVVVADPARIEALIRRHYGEDETTLEQALHELATIDGGVETERLSAPELEALAGQAPVVRFVNLVLTQAIRDRASDLHFEPFESGYRIRCRVDGALRDLPPPPRSLALPIASRLKVLAHLDIAERRVPQDGRIRLTLGGRPVDLRLSTLPTQGGESVVLRVLDQGAVRLELAELGMPASIESGLRDALARPNGLIVVTGPTGSGKTTTLYSALRILNGVERKLLTAEDPVEYEVEGVMQVPVNAGIGLSFGRVLRSLLRHDPDVLMVGEIRDAETARIAVQAALTGHLVLATLHTNDAPGAVTRLIDMGVEPYLIAATLEAVLAQRLVRRCCPACSPPRVAGTSSGPHPTARGDARPRPGCSRCGGAGYSGRLGLFEWMPMSETLRAQVAGGSSAAELRRLAAVEGMQTLRTVGMAAVRDGLTTEDEVRRHT